MGPRVPGTPLLGLRRVIRLRASHVLHPFAKQMAVHPDVSCRTFTESRHLPKMNRTRCRANLSVPVDALIVGLDGLGPFVRLVCIQDKPGPFGHVTRFSCASRWAPHAT